MMRCLSCQEEYGKRDAGTCRECSGKAIRAAEKFKREKAELKAINSFLSFQSPDCPVPPSATPASDMIFLHPVCDDVPPPSGEPSLAGPAVPVHRLVLVSRSAVFKAMLERETEESRSGRIKIHDVSYEDLVGFVRFLYSGKLVFITDQRACRLIVLAEKYMVDHLKVSCEKFLVSKIINAENALASYTFARQQNAKRLQEASLSLIIENIAKIIECKDYKDLVERDPQTVVEIYEAYVANQTSAAREHLSSQEQEVT